LQSNETKEYIARYSKSSPLYPCKNSAQQEAQAPFTPLFYLFLLLVSLLLIPFFPPFFLTLSSALLTVVHVARSIIPWGDAPRSFLQKKSLDPFRRKYRRRQSLIQVDCFVSQPSNSASLQSYRMPVALSMYGGRDAMLCAIVDSGDSENNKKRKFANYYEKVKGVFGVSYTSSNVMNASIMTKS
jgi:hypothetical protein